MTLKNHTYKLPGTADIALKEALSTKLKELFSTAVHNSFELYLYAAALRKRYLDEETGDYKPQFHAWYETHEIHTIFGKLPSFTKYAKAGDVVNYFANDFCEGKYISQIPVSRNALYELSLIVSAVEVAELEKLFFSQGEDGDALITPSTGAPELERYRRSLKAKLVINTKGRSREFTIPLATIYVSKELFKFDKKTGEHQGRIGIDEAKAVLEALQGSVDAEAFDVRTNIEKIATKYEKKMKKASPSRALREAKKS